MSPDTAPVQASSAGVKMGAKAYSDAKETKEIFHADLMSRGVLPVYVVLENRTKSEVQVLRARVSFLTGTGQKLTPTSPDAASTTLGRNALAEAVLIGGVFSYSDADRYNNDMRRDWTEKGMAEVTIVQPGVPTGRFLYFDVGKGFDPTGSVLTIPLGGVGDGERDAAALRF